MTASFDSLKADYDRDGFVIVRQFLDAAQLAQLRQELDRYIHAVVPSLPDSDAFYDDRKRPETLKQMQHMDGDPFFRDYPRHERWQALATTLIGEAANGQAPEWFNKPPGTNHVTPPHQDNYYFCLRPPHVVTIWLALDVVDEENGCLRYLPGSHVQGIRPHGRSQVLGFSQGISDYGVTDFAREVPVCLAPGDAVAHHGNTVHRADPNRSPTRHRRAFAMVYRGVSCQRDEEAFQRYRSALQAQHAAMGLQT